MAVLEFKLPDIGEGVHEGEIVRWIKKAGDAVKVDEPVVEVMTDKATVEIPAPSAGVIGETRVAEGKIAKVGEVIFTITAAGGGTVAPAPAAAAAAVPPTPAKAAAAAAPAATPTPAAPVAPAQVAHAAPAAAPAPAAGGGRLEFKLPDIGEGVHEGEIVRWIKKAGEAVKVDEPVVEVMTDKATVEIPSPASGTIAATNVAEGKIAKVGEVIFVIATAGGAAAPAASAVAAPAAVAAAHAPAAVAAHAPAAAPATAGSAAAAPADPGAKVLAAPATRRLARELGVNLGSVRGTGPNGRVRPEDVRAASAAPASPPPAAAVPVAAAAHAAPVAAAGLAPAAAPAPAPTAAVPAVTPAPAAPAKPLPAFAAVAGTRAVERIPFRGIRRKTAEAMARSKRTAAHFSLIEEVDCTELVAAREVAKKAAERYGVKMTFMPFIMKATALALQEFPQLNAELDEAAQEIVQKKFVGLGIAVDTPNGLVVPVVKDAHLKGLLQLAADLADVGARARAGKLRPDDFKDSTFSITNAGNIGGMFATPVINFPEVAILGVHAMRRRPVCVGDQIVARDVMLLSISIDHRLVDGADGARFMVRMKEMLEQPALMLM